jgi:hypothetical protein
LLLAAAALLLAQTGGIPARSAPTDYATRNVKDGVTLAATVVSPEQLKKLFSKDLNHEGILAIEVAVYPATGSPLDISPDEFTLKVGTNGAIMPTQTPAAIAAGDKKGMQSKTVPPTLPGNVHVYQGATIGYESRGNGPYGRTGGVYTGTSTTVAIGDPRYPPPDPGPYPNGNPRYPGGNYPGPNYPPSGPSSQPPPRGAKPDWTAVKQELEAKELPAGRTAESVAGYLYFLKPTTKEKSPDYELVWYRSAGQIRLAIPPPKNN